VGSVIANWYHWLEEQPGRWLHMEGYGPLLDPGPGCGPHVFTRWRIVGMEKAERARVGLHEYTQDEARQLIAELHRAHKIPHVRSA